MDGSNHNRSTYQSYPYLTKGEFAEVCHYLDRRYCRATLGPLRRQWRLHVHTALELSFEAGPGRTTFLQITRPLDGPAEDHDLVGKMDGMSLDGGLESRSRLVADDAVVKMEDSDNEVLTKRPRRPTFQTGYVTYEIHLHPTYRAPCLWFSLHNLPDGEPALNVETVFRRLVPKQFKDSLRNVGPMGVISIDHHPVTGVPSFFVHPCAVGDAMAGFDCPKTDYLMAWLGLVGGCVGLWVPHQMATVNAG